jgi:hypothetical protein
MVLFAFLEMSYIGSYFHTISLSKITEVAKNMPATCIISLVQKSGVSPAHMQQVLVFFDN